MKRLWNKALSQYVYFFSSLSLQLTSLFLLPRFLGANQFAVIAYAQSFAILISLFVEYGFSFSATRSLAISDGSTLPLIVNRVRNTNYLLAMFFLVVGLFIGMHLPLLEKKPEIVFLSVLLGTIQALTPWWYFQGREQVSRLVLWELMATIITVVLWSIFFVCNINSAFFILLIQLVFRLIVMLRGQFLVFQDVGFIQWNWKQIQLALREGLTPFIFVASVALYTTINVLLLGFYAKPEELAIFVVAEKLLRLSIRVFEPLNRLFYPSSVRVFHQKSNNSNKLVFIRRIFWGYFVVSILVIFPMYKIVGLFLPYALGDKFIPSIELFYLLLSAIPMIAASNVLGILYLLPSGFDKTFNGIIIAGGALHLTLSILTVQIYGVVAMPMSIVFTETIVTLTMIVVVYRHFQSHRVNVNV